MQWKIPEHCTVADLLQRLGRAGRNGQPAISLILVEKKHILPDEVEGLEGSDFVNMRLRVKMTNKTGVSKLYDSNLQTTREKHLTAYHRVDPAILWFVNSVGCRRRLALALFMCKRAFRPMNHEACCDNCLYANVEV